MQFLHFLFYRFMRFILVSGERLMYLTSKDGDWFLDELCTMCGNISQLLSVLKNNPLVSYIGLIDYLVEFCNQFCVYILYYDLRHDFSFNNDNFRRLDWFVCLIYSEMACWTK